MERNPEVTRFEAYLRVTEPNEDATVKTFLLVFLILTSGCTEPVLSTDMTFGTGGVAVNPTLSGKVGDATIIVQP
jgi:hypothetical protein